MAVKTFTSTALSSSDVNTYLANAGLVYVAHANITSGSSYTNVLGCFSATYNNYVVSYSDVTASNNGVAMLFKLLSGSTATTAGFYGNTFYIANAAAGGLSNAVLTNAAYGECGSVSSTFKNAAVFEVNQPFLSTQTNSNFMNTDNNYFRFGGYVLNNSSSYNGIQLLPAACTFSTGTVVVYGRRLG